MDRLPLVGTTCGGAEICRSISAAAKRAASALTASEPKSKVAAKLTGQNRFVKNFWRRLEYGYLKPLVHRLQPWRQVSYGDVRVHYKRHLDGGGSAFGQDYIPFLHDRGMPKQERVFEFIVTDKANGFTCWSGTASDLGTAQSCAISEAQAIP